MQAAKSGHRCLHGHLRRGGVGHIKVVVAGSPPRGADRRGYTSPASLVAVADDDRGALTRVETCDLLADARTCPRYQGDLAIQPKRRLPTRSIHPVPQSYISMYPRPRCGSTSIVAPSRLSRSSPVSIVSLPARSIDQPDERIAVFTAIEGIGTVSRSGHKEQRRRDVAPDRRSDHTTCARARSDAVRVSIALCLLTSIHHSSRTHAAPSGNA